MSRRRLGALKWAALVDEWRQSGLKLPEFCRREGLVLGTMQGWDYKPPLKRAIENARRAERITAGNSSVRSKPSAPDPTPAFLPVRLAEVAATPAPELKNRDAIEVVLNTGRRVVVGPGFDQETLRRVVATLESFPC
jgi:hypothetical protein